MTIEPPEGSSSVVSARRTLRPGIVRSLPPEPVSVKDPSADSSDTSVLTRRLMRPSDSTTGVKLRATPNGLNWMVMLPVWSRPVGTGNSPPARKRGDLAGDGGQRRLGQRPDHAGLLERAQRRRQAAGAVVVAPSVSALLDSGLLAMANGLPVVLQLADRSRSLKLPTLMAPLNVDAELLGDVALDLGDGDLEVNLILALDGRAD